MPDKQKRTYHNVANLLHSTVNFTQPAPASSQYDAQVQQADFITHNVTPALVTTDLLHPNNSVFADLISSHLSHNDAQLVIVVQADAIDANPDLPAHVDRYFAAHPELNYFDNLELAEDAINEVSDKINQEQLVLAFGGQQFLHNVSSTLNTARVAHIAIATRAEYQTMTQYDAIAHLLQNKKSQLKCVCLDSKLIISDLQYNRSTWVVRGIQHSLFHDSQMFHWIEGNFHRLLGEERTAIDHLFIKVINKLIAPADQTSAETQLHKLFFSLWKNEYAKQSLNIIGYAQAMTTTLLLSVQYAIQLESLEEGIDARLLGLLKQIVWIAPGNARRLQASEALQEIPVLEDVGRHTMQQLDKRAMQHAEAWLAEEAQRLTYAA